MKIFYFPEYEALAKNISKKTSFPCGDMVLRQFPDGETYVKINSIVKNEEIILICGLDNPDTKIMPLMFFAQTAKELGAKKIGLVAPYLGYMRMDKRFNDGEAVTSKIFAKILSNNIDWLVTIEPHLHRYKSLEEIYSINCQVLHVHDLIGNWIKENVKKPILIGPDEESKKWVEKIASSSNSPFIILNKVRFGDKKVKISFPQIEKYQDHVPILIDDIISTAGTMIETINHLKTLKTPAPICIAVHAIFAGNSYSKLQKSGAQKIITCTTIKHISNAIGVDDILAEAIIRK